MQDDFISNLKNELLRRKEAAEVERDQVTAIGHVVGMYARAAQDTEIEVNVSITDGGDKITFSIHPALPF